MKHTSCPLVPPSIRHLLISSCLFLLATGILVAANIFPDPLLPTGSGPVSVAAADFNGDGVIDLAAANSSSGDLSILLGRGNGEFEPEQRVPMGGAPNFITAADLNADGKIDLAVTNAGNGVLVFHGQGDGTFPSRTGYSVLGSPTFVTAADLNLDGFQDLAVVNSVSGNVAVLRGRADGTFNAPNYFPAGLGAYSLVVVDFNQDGSPDLAVATAYDSKEAVMLFGHGNGQFDPPLSLGGGTSGRFICSGDFNRDGRPDLAVIENFHARLSVLLGNGSGGVLTRNTLEVEATTNWVGSADFDGDGALDLATSGSLLLGHGDGSFDPFIPSGALAAGCAIADLDADGSPDLAGAEDATTGGVFVLFNDGQGQLGARAYPIADFAGTIVKGDFNSDGVTDLAASGEIAGTIAVLLGHEDGTFAPESGIPAAAQVQSIAAGDFDGDSQLDLAFSTSTTGAVSTLLGLGNGTFQTPVQTQVGTTPSGMITGEFNGDGRADLVAFRTYSPYVQVLLGKPDGTFEVIDQVGLPQIAYAVAAGDFNADGRQDLAVAYVAIESITILSGKGDGTFATGGSYGAGDHLFSLGVGDLNGDGKLDLAAGHSDVGFITFSLEGCCDALDKISVLLGQGDGSFEQEVRYDSGKSVSVGIADFDRDGRPDLLASGSVLLPGAGGGTFGLPKSYAHFGPGVVDDFNQDGWPDAAAARGRIVVALNLGPLGPPTANAGSDASVECASAAGAEVLLDGSASHDAGAPPGVHETIELFEWFENFEQPGVQLLGTGETLHLTLPLGVHHITLRVTDISGASATDEVTVTIADTVGPSLTANFTPNFLWPPNSQLVDIIADVHASDACGGSVDVRLTSIQGGGNAASPSNKFASNVAVAEIGTADFSFQLRAVPATSKQGAYYLITYTATDAAGNQSIVTGTIPVTHNLGDIPQGVPGPVQIKSPGPPTFISPRWYGIARPKQ